MVIKLKQNSLGDVLQQIAPAIQQLSQQKQEKTLMEKLFEEVDVPGGEDIFFSEEDTNEDQPYPKEPSSGIKQKVPRIQTWSDEKLSKELSNKKVRPFVESEFKRRELLSKKESDLWNYKPTQKFLTDVEENATEAEFSNQVADEIISLAPNVDPKNIRTFLASKFGENLPFLFTTESGSLKFLEKLQAKGLKNIFPRPTEKEFMFINSAQAQLGKTPEANIAIANLQKRFNNIPIKSADFTQEVIRENGGVPPRNIQAQVRKKMNSYKDSLINEAASISYKYGEGQDKLRAMKYLKDNDSPVVNGPRELTEDVAMDIFIQAGKDPEKAKELAIEMGFEV